MSLRMWLGAAAEHQRLRPRGPPHQHQRLRLGVMGSFEKGDIVVDGAHGGTRRGARRPSIVATRELVFVGR